MTEFKYTSNNFPWNNSLAKSCKWRIKLAPNDEIIKSLEDFTLEQTNASNNVVIGFAEFRMLGSVWADSVQYNISEEFGNVKPFYYGEENFKRKEEKEVLGKIKIIRKIKRSETLTEEDKKIVTNHQELAERVKKGDKFDEEEYLTETEKKNRKKLEVLFCYGTISWEQSDKSKKTNPYDKPKAHAHITFAENNNEYNDKGEVIKQSKGDAFGGHLGKAKVSIVAEIIVDVMTTEKAKLGDKNWDEKQNFNL